MVKSAFCAGSGVYVILYPCWYGLNGWLIVTVPERLCFCGYLVNYSGLFTVCTLFSLSVPCINTANKHCLSIRIMENVCRNIFCSDLCVQFNVQN